MWQCGCDDIRREIVKNNGLRFSHIRTGRDNEFKLSVELRNLKIDTYKDRLIIGGSLSKFINGNNYNLITCTDIRKAFAEIETALNLPVCNGQLKRVDVGGCFPVAGNVQEYCGVLDEMPRYRRGIIKNSLYFEQSEKSMVFYDKHKESKAHHTTPPVEWVQVANVMRYELRLLSHLPRYLNRKRVTAQELCDPVVLCGLVDMWKQEYNKIKKLASMEFVPSNIKTPKQWDNVCVLLLVEKFGLNSVLDKINLTGLSKDQKKRLRQRIRAIYRADTNSLLNATPLAQELDNAINNAYNSMLDYAQR